MISLRSSLGKALKVYSNGIGGLKSSFSKANNAKLFLKKFNSTATLAAENTRGQKLVGYWLGACAGMVAGAVVLGGVTRLTESGLSMVDWRLLKDMVPPKNEQEWIDEFERYKQYPEFKYLNKEMTVGEFKFIYYMEWGHRMWGRCIGLAFFIPAAIFWRKGFFDRLMKFRIVGYGGLLGFQGFLGWYMVKSGLNEPKKETDIPRVSQYRLAAHLGSAFLLYTGFLWSSLTCLLEPQKCIENAAVIRKAMWRAHYLKALIFGTALLGAFVAGLDAGLVYNSFPKMADRWIPSDLFALEPKWTNFFENPTTVQFNHRIFGMSTLTAICLYAFSLRGVRLPPRARLALNSLVTMSFIQVSLGIATLLYYVPVKLAATHQFGSLTLLSFSIWLANELKRIPKI